MRLKFDKTKNGYDMQQVDEYIDRLRGEYSNLRTEYDKAIQEKESYVTKIKQLEELEGQQNAIAAALVRTEAFAAKAEQDAKKFIEKRMAETKAICEKVIIETNTRAKQIITEAESEALKITATARANVKNLIEQESQLRASLSKTHGDLAKILVSFNEGGIKNGEQRNPQAPAQNS
jgi:DivIVA domain-containing protein